MNNRGRVAGALVAASIVIVATLLPPPVHAHEPTVIDVADPFHAAAFHTRIFTDDDGLPQSSVESLRFAPDGLLWATTRDGGASFDGSLWTALAMPATAGSNWPRVTLVSSDGTVWFGAEGGGLVRYAGGKWSSVTHPRLAGRTITALAETSGPDDRQVIWAGLPTGLVRIDARSLDVTPLASLDGVSVTALQATETGLLAGSATGEVFRCRGASCVADPLASSIVAGARVTGFAEEGSGSERSTWIATDRGVGHAGPGRREIELPGKRVNAVALTRDQRGDTKLWVALDGEGMLLHLGDRWIAPLFAPALPNGYVFALAPYPASGATRHLFAGTLNGVVRIDVVAWRSIDASTGLPDSSVFSMLDAESEAGREYLLGTSAGLARFHGGAWRRVESELVASKPIFALLRSRDGKSVYAGTDVGLATRHAGTWVDDDSAAGLPREPVVSLLEAGEGAGRRLWAGTYGAGLWSRDTNGKWHRIEGLPDERIEALAAAEHRGALRLWAATDRGLARIDADNLDVISKDHGLPSDIVRSLLIAEGPDGRSYLWVGTAGGFAWRLADDDGAPWETLSQPAGAAMPGNNVYQIQAGSSTRFWLFTGRGIVRVTFPSAAPPLASRAVVRTFTTADGLPSNECNFGASMVDSRGRFWAGTTRGAALFDPGAVADDRAPKTLRLTDARSIRTAASLMTRDVLRRNENDVAFRFQLVDPGRGERALYRTQLVGRDEAPGDWIRATERTFTGLAPGHYTFRVWGRDVAGNVSGPVELRFRVLAPAWRAWWAVLAYIAIAIGILATVHWIRIRTFRARAEKLERVVRSRTRDLERMNRELEAANAALADMSVTDPLTGAKNRRYLGQQMEREAGRVGRSMRNDDDLMFFLVDIDLFKHVNDSFGHIVGDAILRQFCGALASAVRDTDTIVRWGGEEFLIVARRSSRAEAPRIADRIIETVRAEVFDAFDGRMVQLSCSLGWAVFPFVSREPAIFNWDEVIDIADHCLLAAKASGRDCWVGLAAGPGLIAEKFFQRLRTSALTMTDASEIEVSTSLANPSDVRWQ